MAEHCPTVILHCCEKPDEDAHFGAPFLAGERAVDLGYYSETHLHLRDNKRDTAERGSSAAMEANVRPTKSRGGGDCMQ